MKIGSLFSGYGGLDMAAEAVLGGTTSWVSDVSPGACKLLAHRYPHAPNLGDITTIDWSQVEPVDIITGGSHCQDLSTAGRRAGMRPGTRSGLWESMREAIAIIRPQYVIWENVRGALSAPAHSDMELDEGRVGDGAGRPALRALGRVLGDLADLGYDAEWHSLRASDVGAPHQRFRVFVLAYPGSLPVGTAAVGELGVGIPLVTGQHRPPATDPGHVGPHRARRTRDGRIGPTDGRHPVADTYNQGGEEWPGLRERPCECVARARSLDPSAWGDYWPAIRRWELVNGPAPAPTDDRGRLAATFPEWMMGLPAGWITDVPGITRTEALQLAGNGVVPQQAARAISIMLDRAAMWQECAA